MIRIENIDKYFNPFKKNKIHVIQNTSLVFEDTGLVTILGPSGSGKTTLLNVIGGLDKVRKGNIYINNQKITNRLQGTVDKIRNLNIGYIFQDYKLVEDLSVFENVSLVLKMLGIKDKKEIEKRVLYVLDKVGMLRYKNRPCNMLSGGERQRVGIARAIVKNPNIIIADEPTGNLDSKNSVEVMNIIKAISKEKLVILVTHEQALARFFSTRIIEIEDGKIIKDYLNDNQNDLDYENQNVLYLKDYDHATHYSDNIHVYSNEMNNLKLNIVVTKHNIYIKSLDNRKIEVLDDNSSMEMVDDYHKKLSYEDMNKYVFDYQNIINDPKKLKYSSIFNPISFISNGFSKVLNYSVLKKILLIGFFLSGFFIQYATSNIVSTLTIRDKDFVSINKNYLVIESKKIKLEDYYNYEDNLGAEYIIPTNSIIRLNVKTDDFYQTSKYSIDISGSLSSLEMINSSDLIAGRLPVNANEIVVDKMTLKKAIDSDVPKMVGIDKVNKFLNRYVSVKNMNDFQIVGIVDLESPSIYTDRSVFINLLYHTSSSDIEDSTYLNSIDDVDSMMDVDDFNLFTDRIILKEGRYPVNDYEVIVNNIHKEEYKLNKEINKTIQNRKLVVVGYYTTKEDMDTYLVNPNMIKQKVISKASDVSVYSKSRKDTLNYARNTLNINMKDSYESSRQSYLKKQKEKIKSSLIGTGIILGISLIEILLMIRSSFLSRIKEVGIYRAIGVKKKDIYIMFSGEIIAITTFASIPGILLCAYILKLLSNISLLSDYIVINSFIVIASIILVFVFNLIVGLIPVFNTMRKRPAEILARTDI